MSTASCVMTAHTSSQEWRQYPITHGNPEMVSSSVPRSVLHRCREIADTHHTDHRAMVFTWMTLKDLIILKSGVGPDNIESITVGLRELAREAGVSLNTLAGKDGSIQRFIEAGLVEIVGTEPVPGKLAKRTIYRIHLARLEAESVELVDAMYREGRLSPRPPKESKPKQQLPLFDADTVSNQGMPTAPPQGAAGALFETVPQHKTEHIVPFHGTSKSPSVTRTGTVTPNGTANTAPECGNGATVTPKVTVNGGRPSQQRNGSGANERTNDGDDGGSRPSSSPHKERIHAQ